ILDFRFWIDSTDKSRGGYHMKKFLVILDHASDSPDRVIYGNHSIISNRSAFLGNQFQTKGKKMQKTEFFLNSAF
ncbi:MULTISPECIES: hypothetical protein, partial [unclassified Microcoleus]|uniref:hypothetical protein n=1 Tax=unclassified Microcoleus TaxID=2642155 RepID=UPI002FD59EC7